MPDPYWGLLQKGATDSELIEAAIERVFNSHNFVMFVPAWGNVPKSQGDNSTVDDEIDLKVQAHDDDPDAHLDATQSLQSHKASEIIDHAALSIVNDKMKNGDLDFSKISAKEIQALLCFESLDGWAHSTSGVSRGILGTTIQTGSGATVTYWLEAYSNASITCIRFDKDLFFQTGIVVDYDSDQEIFFHMGEYIGDSTDAAFGFKIINGSLYSIVVDTPGGVSTEHATFISVIDPGVFHVYKAFFDHNEGTFYFYVDGVLVDTHVGDIPDQSQNILVHYSITNTSALNRVMSITNVLISIKVG